MIYSGCDSLEELVHDGENGRMFRTGDELAVLLEVRDGDEWLCM